jgi:hypothetical protein
MIWIDAKTKYQCLIRNGACGVLCGYVGVDSSHPLYGKKMRGWDDEETNEDDPFGDLMVHGGVTFADRWPEISSDLWFIGFDCAHAGDIIPDIFPTDPIFIPRQIAAGDADPETISKFEVETQMDELWRELKRDATFKDLNYVAGEVVNLARQLKEME